MVNTANIARALNFDASVREKSSRHDGFTPASRAMRKTVGLSYKPTGAFKEIK